MTLVQHVEADGNRDPFSDDPSAPNDSHRADPFEPMPLEVDPFDRDAGSRLFPPPAEAPIESPDDAQSQPRDPAPPVRPGIVPTPEPGLSDDLLQRERSDLSEEGLRRDFGEDEDLGRGALGDQLDPSVPRTDDNGVTSGADLRSRGLTDCAESWEALQANTLPTIDLDIDVTGIEGEDYPVECTLASETFRPRDWNKTDYLWKASSLCHKPLYFEDVQLERYGHTAGYMLQPAASAAHFFVTLPILPYKMGLKTPHECVYTLGYYRPGSCAPHMIEPLGFTWRAALFEAGAWVGGAAVVP